MTRTTEKPIVLFLAALVIGLVIGLGLGYGFPYEKPGILTKEQVRQAIRERPGGKDLDVKPETIRFLSLSLDSTQGEPIWIVEYECVGRSSLRHMSGHPFTRKLVRVLMNARTGERVCVEAYDLPFPENVLTAEDVQSKIVEELGVGPTFSRFPFVEVKPETVEFRCFILVSLMKYTPSETYRWLVEYECDARGTGLVTVRLNDSKVVEPSFDRWLFRLVIEAHTGELTEAEISKLDGMMDLTIHVSTVRLIADRSMY